MLEDTFSDNLRQTAVISKYELKKYLRGRKIVIFAILMGAWLILNIALPYLVSDGLGTDPNVMAGSFLSIMLFFVVLLAMLFVSGTIVSEFEERTALMLFTKPLRKWSVFMGKIITAFAVGFVFILIYYAITAAVSLVVMGAVSSSMAVSLGLAVTYLFGTAGVAVLISSLVNKSSTAAILTFVTLLMIMTVISGILGAYSVDPWFMLDTSGGNITGCFAGGIDAWRGAGVALVWGLVTGALGYLIFRRREL